MKYKILANIWTFLFGRSKPDSWGRKLFFSATLKAFHPIQTPRDGSFSIWPLQKPPTQIKLLRKVRYLPSIVWWVFILFCPSMSWVKSCKIINMHGWLMINTTPAKKIIKAILLNGHYDFLLSKLLGVDMLLMVLWSAKEIFLKNLLLFLEFHHTIIVNNMAAHIWYASKRKLEIFFFLFFPVFNEEGKKLFFSFTCFIFSSLSLSLFQAPNQGVSYHRRALINHERWADHQGGVQ